MFQPLAPGLREKPWHKARRAKAGSLPTFTFKSPFSAPGQACNREGRALRGKSIGGERILPGDPTRVPQNGAGRPGARSREARNAPTSGDLCSRRKNGLQRPARPVQETICASWFLRAIPPRAGLPGRAWPVIQCASTPTWRKVGRKQIVLDLILQL